MYIVYYVGRWGRLLNLSGQIFYLLFVYGVTNISNDEISNKHASFTCTISILVLGDVIMFLKHPAIIGSSGLCLLGAVVVLLFFWASESHPAYLGKPSWKENIFAWHPVLAVCGFFGSQIIATSVWSFKSRNHTMIIKIAHVVMQSIALTGGIASIYAVAKWKATARLPHVTSMHSWVGIAALLVFLHNYTFALLRQLGKYCFPSVHFFAPTFLHYHRSVGLTSLVLAAMAVVSGIVVKQTGLEECTYYPPRTNEWDPTVHYQRMSVGCRLGNGIGMCVIACCGAVLFATVTRYHTSLKPSNSISDGERADSGC